MTKIRKLMVVCAVALMMLVIALPSALAQDDYYAWEPYYFDPSWVSTPASTDTTTATEPITIVDGEDCVVFENDEGDRILVCDLD